MSKIEGGYDVGRRVQRQSSQQVLNESFPRDAPKIVEASLDCQAVRGRRSFHQQRGNEVQSRAAAGSRESWKALGDCCPFQTLV